MAAAYSALGRPAGCASSLWRSTRPSSVRPSRWNRAEFTCSSSRTATAAAVMAPAASWSSARTRARVGPSPASGRRFAAHRRSPISVMLSRCRDGGSSSRLSADLIRTGPQAPVGSLVVAHPPAAVLGDPRERGRHRARARREVGLPRREGCEARQSSRSRAAPRPSVPNRGGVSSASRTGTVSLPRLRHCSAQAVTRRLRGLSPGRRSHPRRTPFAEQLAGGAAAADRVDQQGAYHFASPSRWRVSRTPRKAGAGHGGDSGGVSLGEPDTAACVYGTKPARESGRAHQAAVRHGPGPSPRAGRRTAASCPRSGAAAAAGASTARQSTSTPSASSTSARPEAR